MVRVCRWAALVIVASGCSFDPSGTPGGGTDSGLPDSTTPGGDSAGGSDADIGTGPFGPAVRLDELGAGGAKDDDPTLTGDRLEIFFNSNRSGNGEIWTSTRTAITDPWDTPSLVDELNSPASESDPEVSQDGLTIYFDSDRSGGLGGSDVWVSTRTSRAASWSTPVNVPELSSDGDEFAPAPVPSQRHLVLSSTRTPTAGGEDVFIATRGSTGQAWQAPANIAEINSPSTDSNPFATADVLTVFFDSQRSPGMGGRDLWFASRASMSDPFDAPEPLPGINTTGDDADPWLSADLKHIVFASDRDGEYELYEAFR